jgi:hypothetical protein
MNVFQKSNRLNELENLTNKNNDSNLDNLKLTKKLQELKKESTNIKTKRDKGISLRISQETFNQLNTIKEETNLSQADIVTLLVEEIMNKAGK